MSFFGNSFTPSFQLAVFCQVEGQEEVPWEVVGHLQLLAQHIRVIAKLAKQSQADVIAK